jgi:hypothetical protein
MDRALVTTGAIDLFGSAACAVAPFARLAAGLRDAAPDRSPGNRKTARLKMAPQAFEITESAPENGTCCALHSNEGAAMD